MVVFSGPNMNHAYYQFPFLPVLAVFAAKGVIMVQNSGIFQKTLLNNKIGFGLAVFVMIIPLMLASRGIFSTPKSANHVALAGKRVDQLVPKDALVLAAHGSGPVFLYYCNRKGKEFQIHRELLLKAYERQNAEVPEDLITNPIDYLEKLRKEGAQYFAVANLSRLTSHHSFANYMFRNYTVIDQSKGKYVIFDIKNKKMDKVTG